MQFWTTSSAKEPYRRYQEKVEVAAVAAAFAASAADDADAGGGTGGSTAATNDDDAALPTRGGGGGDAFADGLTVASTAEVAKSCRFRACSDLEAGAVSSSSSASDRSDRRPCFASPRRICFWFFFCVCDR